MPTIGLQGGTDVFDLFDSQVGDAFRVPLLAAQLRNELSSVSTKDFQPNLWQEGTPHCSDNATNGFEASDQCYQGGTTFTNISTLLDPYIAQLPASYQTGLITQYLPRMNSSVSYTHTTLGVPSRLQSEPSYILHWLCVQRHFARYSSLHADECLPVTLEVNEGSTRYLRRDVY